MYSFLPSGKYHRPIKSGAYSVTYSAPGYHSKTLPITIFSDSLIIQNVELVPTNHAVNESLLDPYITLFPNPSSNFIIVDDHSGTTTPKLYSIFDIKGNKIYESTNSEATITIPLNNIKSGIYFLTLKIENQMVVRKFVKK